MTETQYYPFNIKRRQIQRFKLYLLSKKVVLLVRVSYYLCTSNFVRPRETRTTVNLKFLEKSHIMYSKTLNRYTHSLFFINGPYYPIFDIDLYIRSLK